jgi:hypothetical protein
MRQENATSYQRCGRGSFRDFLFLKVIRPEGREGRRSSKSPEALRLVEESFGIFSRLISDEIRRVEERFRGLLLSRL